MGSILQTARLLNQAAGGVMNLLKEFWTSLLQELTLLTAARRRQLPLLAETRIEGRNGSARRDQCLLDGCSHHVWFDGLDGIKSSFFWCQLERTFQAGERVGAWNGAGWNGHQLAAH